MSEKPSEGSVKQILAQSIEINRLQDQRNDDFKMFSEVSSRIRETDRELARLRLSRYEMIGTADVTSDGNFGHDGRWTWFIDELVRQATAVPLSLQSMSGVGDPAPPRSDQFPTVDTGGSSRKG